MNLLKAFGAWLSWKKGKQFCDVFKYTPDEVRLPLITTSPFAVVELNNDCPYVVQVEVINYNEIKDNLIFSKPPPIWIDAESPFQQFVGCQHVATVPMILESDTGESKVVEVYCESTMLQTLPEKEVVPGKFTLEARRLDPTIDTVELSLNIFDLRTIYHEYYGMTECCKKCTKGLWHSFCQFYDALSIPVPPSLQERFCEGCPVEDQTCQKHLSRTFCDFYESLDVPFLENDKLGLCKKECAVRDLRMNPAYVVYPISPRGPSKQAIQIDGVRFPFFDELVDYTQSEMYVFWNGIVVTDDVPDASIATIEIPNAKLRSFFAPLWANYISVQEVGGVLSAEKGIAIQWTDLKTMGGGYVTVQLFIEPSGDWRIRTANCTGDTYSLKNAVSGWQAGSLEAKGSRYDQIQICDPCNIALDFSFHRQTKYVPGDIDLTLSPSTLNTWNKGVASFQLTVGDVPADEVAMKAEILYTLPGSNELVGGTLLSVKN